VEYNFILFFFYFFRLVNVVKLKVYGNVAANVIAGNRSTNSIKMWEKPKTANYFTTQNKIAHILIIELVNTSSTNTKNLLKDESCILKTSNSIVC
jgi:hypothetical protein